MGTHSHFLIDFFFSMSPMPLVISLLCPQYFDLCGFFIFPDRHDVPKKWNPHMESTHQILLWSSWITLPPITLGVCPSIFRSGKKETGKGESHSAQGRQLAGGATPSFVPTPIRLLFFIHNCR